MKVKLVEFEISDLYGLYTHRIGLESPESISIIHGPNGVGKTAFLKSIYNLFNCEFGLLSKISFSQISAKISDGTEILVKRSGVSSEELIRRSKASSHKLEIELIRNRKTFASYTFIEGPSRSRNIPPWYVRVGPDVWLDESTGEEIPKEVIDEAFRSSIKGRDKKNLDLITLTLKGLKVHFIETNRLFKQDGGSNAWQGKKEAPVSSSVRDCAKQLIVQVSTALKDYGKKSQELDQSFPHRFISEPATPMALDDLKNRLVNLTAQLKRLRAIGILDTEGNQPFDTESLDTVERHKLEVMNLYVRDSEKKLAVFDSLSSRVQLLLDSLKLKFKNKSVHLSKEKGLVVVGPTNLDIELDSLSSGEQHEIVLLYELLFKVPENTLILIDEPELSLHVSWQKAFLPELISIAEEVGFYSILATHSPFIVGGRYDLMTALDSDDQDE